MAWIRACGGGSPAVPDGRTVTPINDVKIWQQCAGIANPTYTTLAEILADVGVLSALMASNNAVDYLVRCKDWAGKALVPTMTSDTTPSGECFANAEQSTHFAYSAFDNDDTTFWAPSDGSITNAWVGYSLTEIKNIASIFVKINDTSSRITDMTVKIQGSNTGNVDDWHDISNVYNFDASWRSTGFRTNIIESNYQHIRMLIPSCTLSDYTVSSCRVATLQFYTANICDNQYAMQYIGQNNYASNTLLGDSDWCSAICDSTYFESVLNVKVPIMTSNTTPSGECSGTSIQHDSDYYNAFDGVTLFGQPAYVSEIETPSLRYDFGVGKGMRLFKIALWGNPESTLYNATSPRNFNLEYSDDGSIWSNDTEVYTYTYTQGVGEYKNFKASAAIRETEHRGFGIKVQSNYNGAGSTTIVELQFYGRADV